ncbi:MAG: right-handed parallel beta-helix repeat-containing protein [Treponema sp.]|jgi:hypothetical protein|nr:right-handed parallel beta-helix repeat-containing protein [Treponema sp.]
MERLLKVFGLVLVMAGLGSCDFILGPDEPAGSTNGNLVISLGADEGGRAITSGVDLPASVRDILRYELSLTGPSDEVFAITARAGETHKLTVAVGQWRIDAAAYQEQALAGTGSVSLTVTSGTNTVRLPMRMNGPCYEVKLDPSIPPGTVKANFSAAFEGTPITVAVVAPEDQFYYRLGSLIYYYDGTYHYSSGDSLVFSMPAADVRVEASIFQFVRYVKTSGTSTGDGLSWETASNDLQKMMDELKTSSLTAGYYGSCIVKLGAGTYKPQWEPMVPSSSVDPYVRSTPTDPRDAAFILRGQVELWGGYPASGGDEASRNITAYKTILSGDIGTPGVNTDNSYHVVLGVDIPAGPATILDGLTISGGKADGSSSITVGGQTILQNAGGGMYNASSSPELTNVTISGNSAGNVGGGMYNDSSSSPVLTNVTFSGNSASTDNDRHDAP